MSPTDEPSDATGNAGVVVGGSLASKINYLFETVRRADGKPYSNEEVAEAITELGEASISGTYLWYLRRGDRDNPTKKHLETLARFFDVSPAFFFDDARSRQIAMTGRASRTDEDARRVAALLCDLSPRSRRAVTDLIGRVRELEGLPAAAPSPCPPRTE